MSFTRRIEPSDKVRKRVHACRDAGLTVRQDFIAGIMEVHDRNSVLILRCVRQPDMSWETEYNDDFWEEQKR